MANKRNTILAMFIAVIIASMCICTTISLALLAYSGRSKAFLPYIKATANQPNYTSTFDFYLRGYNGSSDTLWTDIKATTLMDDDVWYTRLSFETYNYYSVSEFANLDDGLIGTIDYENARLSKPWTKITSSTEDLFQQAEPIISKKVIRYDKFLEIVEENTGGKIVKSGILGNEYKIKITDKEGFVTDLLNYIDPETDISSSDTTVEEAWAAVHINNGIVVEIKAYFSNASLKIDGNNVDHLDGGFTMTMSEVGTTSVDEPPGWIEKD